MIPGMDAAAQVTPDMARSLGAQFVCRYLAPYPAQAWKLCTPSEVKALTDAGIPVVFNWESDGTPGNGWGTGVDAANQAQALLNDRGWPNAPVIFTFADVDVAQANIPTLIAAHRGAVSVLGLSRCGGYGGFGAIKALFDAGVITFGWQTYAWSGGQWDPRAQLRQCANGLTDVVSHDYDEAWAIDYGQVPRPTTQEDDMPYTPQQLHDMVAQAVTDVLYRQDQPSRVPGSPIDGSPGKGMSLADAVMNSDRTGFELWARMVPALAASVSAQVQAAPGQDPTAYAAEVKAAVVAALSTINITTKAV